MTVGSVEDAADPHGAGHYSVAMTSILGYIDQGKKEGRLMTGGKRTGAAGYFIEPTVIADVDRKARIFQEEAIFILALAVTKA